MVVRACNQKAAAGTTAPTSTVLERRVAEVRAATAKAEANDGGAGEGDAEAIRAAVKELNVATMKIGEAINKGSSSGAGGGGADKDSSSKDGNTYDADVKEEGK